MDLWLIGVIAGAGLLLFATWSVARSVTRRRTQWRRRVMALREQYGAEFDRLVEEVGAREAVGRLEERTIDLDSVDVQRASPAERAEFTQRWHRVQHMFLDSPSASLREAEVLVADVMRARNLPTGDFEARVLAIAERDGDLAVRYRAAHDLFLAVESGEADRYGDADFRHAVLTYQELFEVALDRPKGEQSERVDRAPTDRSTPAQSA